MGRKLKIGLITTIALVALMAGVAYAWDRSASERIAAGVTIADLDVGEMTREEAVAAVDRDVAAPLAKPVIVTWNEARFKLNPKRAKLKVDVEGLVGAAFEASDEGNLVSRTWRRVTGSEIDESISAEATFSENRVEEFVAEVAGAIDREPRNATVEPSVGNLEKLHSSAGLAVRQDDLAEAIGEVIGQGERAKVEAEAERIPPDVSTKDLVAHYPHYLTVDRTANVLRYFRDLKPVAEYPVSVGLSEYPTPSGLFTIASKMVNPDWSVPNSDWAGELAGTVVEGGTAENPLRARWMGITDGVGIHGTTAVGNLGGPASHGCIRMSVPDVIALYDQIPTGTPIFIA